MVLCFSYLCFQLSQHNFTAVIYNYNEIATHVFTWYTQMVFVLDGYCIVCRILQVLSPAIVSPTL